MIRWPKRACSFVVSSALRFVGTWGAEKVLDVEIGPIGDVYGRYAMLQRLRRIADHPEITGVLLRIQGAPGGWASVQDLAGVIRDLKRAGKRLYAFLETPGNASVYLGALCDRVFLVPTGEVALVGVGTEMIFFGAALERIGVQPDFEAAGAYKAFGEPFTRSFASPANQEATSHLVNDLHEQLVTGIAGGRGIDREAVERAIAMAPLAAPEAVVEGLVDQLAYTDQIADYLKEQHGSKMSLVPFASWTRRESALEWAESWGKPKPSIAVVHLEGNIVMEGKASGTLRARDVVPVLEHLRENDDIGAVVLHVNSPGGSALASDLMWREVDLLRKAKPVVAAFEDVSASGGFYLSAPATEIMARAGTMTGSIGVFGGKLVAGEGLRKLGVFPQELTVGPNVTMFSPSKPFTDPQRARFRLMLQRFYDGFVERVADGRGRSEEVVEPHCRGRVWTGDAALERGLIDRIGTLEEAIDRARHHAGLAAGDAEVSHHVPCATPWPRRVLSKMVASSPPLETLSSVASQVSLLMEHEGQALAWLPLSIRPR